MTVGRNERCPCGSGKKYKQCCLPRTNLLSLQAVREERSHEELLDRLLELAVSLPKDQGFPDGLIRYFGGPPPEEPSDTEYHEPLDWVLFGYRRPETGTTLAEFLARTERRLTDTERAMALRWAAESVPGIFTVIHAEPGQTHLRRLWEVQDRVVTGNRPELRTGDLVAAWLLPVGDGLRFGYFPYSLPVDLGAPLEHLLREELTLLCRQQPDATWNDLYRSYWPRVTDLIGLATIHGERCRTVRVLSRPQVVGRVQAENPGWSAVAVQLAESLRMASAREEEVSGGLRLWWDAVQSIQPVIHSPAAWAGAVIYLLGKEVYGSDVTQTAIAKLVSTSAASLGQKARAIREAIHVQPFDPRYADLLDEVYRSARQYLYLDTAGPVEGPATQPPRAVFTADDADLFGPDGSPVAQAEALIDRAWESRGKRRLALARRAIDLWSDATDAHVILGHAALDAKEYGAAAQHYRAGVSTGERVLGGRFFSEHRGHFWGLVESRPYMRARAGLADALWGLGEREEAIGHYQELLRLNTMDNMGIRYVLAARLVELGDDRRLAQLLEEHSDDAGAALLFTAALLAFRTSGPGKEANSRLREACRNNPHVPAYLLGRRKLPKKLPDYIDMGGPLEAAAYAAEFGAGWAQTPGALQWLDAQT